MREAGFRSPAHVAAVSMGKKKRRRLPSRGSGTGLLELVTHRSLCPLEQCSDATFQEDRKSLEFNTIIPSDRLVLSLGHPEPAAISGQEPKLSKPLSQTLSPLRKWEGKRERKEVRKARRQEGRLFAVDPGLDGPGASGDNQGEASSGRGCRAGFLLP